MRNTDCFYLEPMRCADNGKMLELCTVMCGREKCASARVQVGVVSTPPSHSRLLLLAECKTAKFSNFCREKNGTKLQLDLPVDGDNVELVVYACCFQLQKEREFDVVVLHHCCDHLSSSHLCECHVCQLGVHESELHLHHVELGDQLEDDDGCGRSEF